MTVASPDFDHHVRQLAEHAARRIVQMVDSGAETVNWTTEELIGLQVHISNLFGDATDAAYGTQPVPPLLAEYRQQCDRLVAIGCVVLRKLQDLRASIRG